MPQLAIRMDLLGSGWAKLTLAAGETSYTIDAVSYVTDVLGDFVRLSLDAVCGGLRGQLSMENEPGEWRVTYSAVGPSVEPQIELRLLRLASLDWPLRPEAEGERVFLAKVNRDDFGRAVLKLASDLLGLHGLEGYRKLWSKDYPYPYRGVAAIAAALTTPTPSL